MRILAITIFFAWAYLMWVLHRTKLSFFKFIIGSVGMFFFLMFVLEPVLLLPLSRAVSATAGFLGNITGIYEAFTEYCLIFISNSNSCISFYIDYECSGIIEIMTFSSLLWFFPLYASSEKTILTLIGIAWIFIANVLRIFIICFIIYMFGNNVFYFAHTVFGRIFFYALSITMYFYVFTKSHVIRQKVGSFSYAKTNN